MRAVRDNLDELLALKAEGRTWAAIAAGMTAQGFATADGRAITERNLTGVVASVRRQTRRLAAKEAGRRKSRRSQERRVPELFLGLCPSACNGEFGPSTPELIT